MARVITFQSAELQGHRINVTPKQLQMYRDAGWNVPIIEAAAYGSVYYGEHRGEPTYTDDEIRHFIAELPRRGSVAATWREDRELLGSDKAGEARMCYSADFGDITGAIYEAKDGTCAWYLWDRDSGVELAAGQAADLDEAQEACEQAATGRSMD